MDKQRVEKPRPGIEEALPFLNVDDRTLDVGCGDSQYLLPIVQQVSMGNVYAVDLSAQALLVSEQWYASLGKKGAVKLVQADAQDLPFPDNYFRLVTNYGMLHGVPNPGCVLHEMMRVLEPGGLLVIFTFHAISPQEWEGLNADRRANGRGRLEIHPGFEPSFLVELLYALGAEEAVARTVGRQTIASPPNTSREYSFPGLLVTARKGDRVADQ